MPRTLIRWCCVLVFAQVLALPALAQGPRFRTDGPEAEMFGQKDGYPTCPGLTYIADTKCRVTAFSAFDTLFPARTIAAGPTPSPLRHAPREPDIRYAFYGRANTLDDYLNTYAVTGLLIAQGDTILVERYQYARTDSQRLTSFSMAKTIIGLLIGLAVGDGAIASIDDPAAKYVPGLADTEYGRTSIKALLQMASGVAFSEDYANTGSDVYMLARATLEQGDPGGALAALRRFDTRVAPPGARMSYSSAESTVLGLVLAGATRRTVADYAREKLWQPLGAEADASWSIDATGQEITYAYFNAVLRDWARLGLMLAHDGIWNGREIVAPAWLDASTKVGPDSPSLGYGYQIWLPPSRHRTIALNGLRGQWVLVDRAARLVLVQTSLRDDSRQALFALWDALPRGQP